MRRALAALGETALVLGLVTVGTFALMALLPGDPRVAILGPNRTKQEYAELANELNLTDPWLSRFWSWIGKVVQGDFGDSLLPPGGPVLERILAAAPVSIQLAIMAMLISLLCSVPIAMWCAYRPGGAVDRVVSTAMFALLSIPHFLAAMILIMAFVTGIEIFPRGGWIRLGDSVTMSLWHALLPTLVIAIMPTIEFTRVLRSDLIDTLDEDFIIGAYARGLPPVRILFRHALRISSFSLITLAAVNFGAVIGSTVIVETIFGLPGMGSLIVRSASQGDLPVVQGAVVVVALTYVISNAMADGAYRFLDPRIRNS